MIINTVTRKRHNRNTNALKKIPKIGGKVDTTKVKETKNLLVLISSSLVRKQEFIRSVKTLISNEQILVFLNLICQK